MDLRTYFRVLWRFRLIVAVGLGLAIVLGLFAYVKVTPKGVSYRQSETWSSLTTLAVTQAGVPVGAVSATGGAYTGLAYYYSGLAKSDAIGRLARRYAHTGGAIQANVEVDNAAHLALPFIDIQALASTGPRAVALANGVARALQSYVAQQQNLAGRGVTSRVALPQIIVARGAKLSAARRKTTPVVIFLTVLIATIGLAFILENFRPRVHVVGRDVDDREDLPAASSGQRSA